MVCLLKPPAIAILIIATVLIVTEGASYNRNRNRRLHHPEHRSHPDANSGSFINQQPEREVPPPPPPVTAEENVESDVENKEELEEVVTESPEEEMKRYRLEMIKQQILNKLRMEQRPNISFPRPNLPEPLAGEQSMMNDRPEMPGNRDVDDFYAQTAQVIVFGERSPNCHSEKPSACFYFPMKESLIATEITTAKLWVYKKKDADNGDRHNQTLTVHALGSPNHSTAQTGKWMTFTETDKKKGWIDFDIKHLVHRWVVKPNRNHGLMVSCKTCQMSNVETPIETDDESKIPFIVIQTSNDHRRERRSQYNCDGDSGPCCREAFFVNFEKIGWSDWILQPDGYWANYCRGTCSGNTFPEYHHSSVMQKVSLSEGNPEKKRDMLPCCSPSKMSAISLLYFTSGGDIVKKNLPNLIVDTCSCS